jgi:hypothetical protein
MGPDSVSMMIHSNPRNPQKSTMSGDAIATDAPIDGLPLAILSLSPVCMVIHLEMEAAVQKHRNQWPCISRMQGR